MDLCRYHPKLETRRERKTVLNNSRTRVAKAKAQEEYTAVDREVKRSIQKDRRDYIDDPARQAKTAVRRGNLRDQEAEGQIPADRQARVLLERMKEAVDPKLGDKQAGFRRNRSCADQITSLRIIVEQPLEWNSPHPLYISFIDYEKAFDSVHRETMWKLLRHCGVPEKIVFIIRCTYQDMSYRTAHAGQLSERFEMKTGVRQECLLSSFLFLLVIDWIMKTTTTDRNNGIQ